MLLNESYLVGETTLDNDIALVQFQSDRAIHRSLTRRNAARHELAFGAEEVSIVEDTTELNRDKFIAESSDVPIKRQPLEIHVRHAKDSSGRRLIAPSRFDPNEAILDDI